jgi:hypothetical protein
VPSLAPSAAPSSEPSTASPTSAQVVGLFESGVTVIDIALDACTNESFVDAFKQTVVEAVDPEVLWADNVTMLDCEDVTGASMASTGSGPSASGLRLQGQGYHTAAAAPVGSLALTFSVSSKSNNETALTNTLNAMKGNLEVNVMSSDFATRLNELCIEYKFCRPTEVLVVDIDSFFLSDVETYTWSFAPTSSPTESGGDDDAEVNSEEWWNGNVFYGYSMIAVIIVAAVITLILCCIGMIIKCCCKRETEATDTTGKQETTVPDTTPTATGKSSETRRWSALGWTSENPAAKLRKKRSPDANNSASEATRPIRPPPPPPRVVSPDPARETADDHLETL